MKESSLFFSRTQPHPRRRHLVSGNNATCCARDPLFFHYLPPRGIMTPPQYTSRYLSRSEVLARFLPAATLYMRLFVWKRKIKSQGGSSSDFLGRDLQPSGPCIFFDFFTFLWGAPVLPDYSIYCGRRAEALSFPLFFRVASFQGYGLICRTWSSRGWLIASFALNGAAGGFLGESKYWADKGVKYGFFLKRWAFLMVYQYT